MKKITIAFDGHSSCGKSTMAKKLAEELGYLYVDTGAMYRAVTLYAIQNGIMDVDTKKIDEAALQQVVDKIVITQKREEGKVRTYLNGVCVEDEIRQMKVSSCVSPIAALGFVRKHLVACQQQMGKDGGIVMDGRDIGTVVFPNAELKVFVTASARVRAERRLLELQAKGDTSLSLEEVQCNIEERDYIDSHREVTPLVQAPDAKLLDNSNMTIPEQNALVLQWAQEAMGE
ncbi:MAG: (d)CMP kinase [Bacteroidales bacterium]|nr:(d)CMP kinase [Bacteroidales bacterium]